MKRSGALVIVASLLLAVSMAAAQEGKVTVAKGAVVSADAQSSTLVVKSETAQGQPRELTFTVGPDAKIFKGTSKITLSDLQSGDKVTVRFKSVEGKFVAFSIEVESSE